MAKRKGISFQIVKGNKAELEKVSQKKSKTIYKRTKCLGIEIFYDEY